MLLGSKIYRADQLSEIIEKEHSKGKKIALANGGFDLLHIGHIRYLRASSECADILVVAVNSDSSLRSLKGDHRAKIDENGRAKILASLEFTDYITIFHESTVENILLSLKPDYHCKGTDYTVDTVPEKNIVESYGGVVKIVGGSKIRSSSDIIKNIKTK